MRTGGCAAAMVLSRASYASMDSPCAHKPTWHGAPGWGLGVAHRLPLHHRGAKCVVAQPTSGRGCGGGRGCHGRFDVETAAAAAQRGEACLQIVRCWCGCRRRCRRRGRSRGRSRSRSWLRRRGRLRRRCLLALDAWRCRGRSSSCAQAARELARPAQAQRAGGETSAHRRVQRAAPRGRPSRRRHRQPRGPGPGPEASQGMELVPRRRRRRRRLRAAMGRHSRQRCMQREMRRTVAADGFEPRLELVEVGRCARVRLPTRHNRTNHWRATVARRRGARLGAVARGRVDHVRLGHCRSATAATAAAFRTRRRREHRVKIIRRRSSPRRPPSRHHSSHHRAPKRRRCRGVRIESRGRLPVTRLVLPWPRQVGGVNVDQILILRVQQLILPKNITTRTHLR